MKKALIEVLSRNILLQTAINEREKELRVELEAFEREVAEKREQITAENKALSDAVADLTVYFRQISHVFWYILLILILLKIRAAE